MVLWLVFIILLSVPFGRKWHPDGAGWLGVWLLVFEISHMRSRWQIGGLRIRIAGVWGHRLGVWGDIQQCHPDRAQRWGISCFLVRSLTCVRDDRLWGIEDTDCERLRSQVGRLTWYLITTMSSRQSAVMRDLWLSSEISHMRSRWQVGGLRVRIAGIWGHRLGVWGDIQQCHPDRAQRRGISGLVTTPYCAYISHTVTKTWTHAIKRLKTTIE